jgi:hypothetical protein
MKRTRVVDTATDPGKPMQGITVSSQKEKILPVESDLSPERIVNGVSTTTALLAQILAQQEEPHQFRDWGINE